MAIDDDLQSDDQTEIFDVDSLGKTPEKSKKEKDIPLYRVYGDSKILISRQVGTMWKRKFDAAKKTYESIHSSWDQVMMYYNFAHTTGEIHTPRGIFKRGDSSENLVYSNLNTVLPAIYSKNPDISCVTTDDTQQDFCDSLQLILTALFRRRDKLNAKPKVKKAAGFGYLTNFGVLRLDWTKKDDSRESARSESQQLSKDLENAKTQEDVNEIYGKLEALDEQMEFRTPSGPSLYNVKPQDLFVDPEAEDDDGCDGSWMIQRVWEKTAKLNAQYTQPGSDGEPVLTYKPTHKAVFGGDASDNSATRNDGVGLVLATMEKSIDVEHHTNQERLAYINTYFSECYLVWDKATARVMLFSRDDWTWPIWVWDATEILNISRFFPYFIIGYGMSTGGTVTVGETSYYLDQQDEINDINRQVARIRRTLYDFFFYNSDAVTKDEAEKFFNALRGKGDPNSKNIIGIACGEEKDISKMIQAFLPPAAQYEPFFNKEPILNTINRVTNTSDALRGAQFKTNTNEDAVQSYQDAARLSIGAKVDVIEDVMSDVASSLGELVVQNMDEQDAANLIGKVPAAGYTQVSIDEYRSMYAVEVVAGSMEKPNSLWKKKEAVQISQGIGQFAQAAPGTSLKIMLRVLEKAFTDLVIHKSDWQSLEAEITATMSKGVSTGGAPGQAQPGQPQPGQPQQPNGGGQGAADPQQFEQMAQKLPPEAKQKVMQMKQQGVPNEKIIAFIQQASQQGQPQGANNGTPSSEPASG